MSLSKKILTGAFNNQIEICVQRYIGRAWKITSIAENRKNSMHCAAFFYGNGYNVFVKEGENPFSHDQFIQEAWGLSHIRETSSVYTPDIIDVLHIDDYGSNQLETFRNKTRLVCFRSRAGNTTQNKKGYVWA